MSFIHITYLSLAYLITLAICGLAVRFGGPAERIGGYWLAANVVLQLVLSGGFPGSPTLHLIVDGIYATGLIPLAAIYVSWFIGIMAFLECASFTLQAVYLLANIPSDDTSMLVNNIITIAATLVLLASTVASWIHRNRVRRAKARLAAV